MLGITCSRKGTRISGNCCTVVPPAAADVAAKTSVASRRWAVAWHKPTYRLRAANAACIMNRVKRGHAGEHVNG